MREGETGYDRVECRQPVTGSCRGHPSLTAAPQGEEQSEEEQGKLGDSSRFFIYVSVFPLT